MQEDQEMSPQSIGESKVVVVSCAGMDKALGSVARAAAFKVTEKLKPNETVLVCIPPLLAQVKPYPDLVKKYPVIVVDGCAERCATKIVAKSGAKIRGRVFIPQSVQKYGLKPIAASDIGSDGEKLAERIAEEIAVQIDKLLGK
jgi:uncharacterized metal-binding protein